MSIYNAINKLKQNIPTTIQAAGNFLNTLPTIEKEQIICAIYLGREHIFHKQLRTDIPIDRTYTGNILAKDYAQIILDKQIYLSRYLDAIERCASASNFDLNNL